MSQTWKDAHKRIIHTTRKGVVRRIKAVVQNEIEDGMDEFETEALYDAANDWTAEDEADFEHEMLCEDLTAYILRGK